ncbi:tetratricopeptide repeat protein [Marinigracilibium pacificum]|uniref:histidine kinase n=1 Tax=Marinigracilibium pacificum TaxID=2729599 RepID=A0A848JB01_9BACT|nr:tetratricopeptide repeat protein [Marinigracilibium pacificum]NMM50212.1 tetratricopeptide repeat protein [Marinigracilibium pacificum]
MENVTNDSSRSAIYAKIGYLFFDLNPDSGYYYGNIGYTIAEKIQNPYCLEKNAVVIGLYYMNLGIHYTALEKAFQALNYSLSRTDSEADQSDCYNLIGMIYNNTKDHNAATEYYTKSLEVALKSNSLTKVSRAYNNLANNYIQIEKFDSASYHLNNALDVNRKINNLTGVAFNLSNLGEVNLKSGNYEEAGNFIKQSMNINKQLNNLRLRSNNYRIYADYYLKDGQINNAIEWALKTKENAKKGNSYKEEIDALFILHECYYVLGDFQKSLDFYKQADELRHSIKQSELATGIEVLQKDYELKQKRNEIKLLEKQNELNNKALNYSKKQVRLQSFIIILGLIILILTGYLFYTAKKRYDTKVKYINQLKKKNNLIQKQAKELNSLNQNLENRVSERTQELELKNEQLKEYAFINSHKLRAPVATILGLIQLLENNMINAFEEKEYNCRLKKALKELDKVIKQITITLEK